MNEPPRSADPLEPQRAAAAPLSDAERARGRRLAIASHPLGMTFQMAFTSHLPTLALVSLGASEMQVGLQTAALSALQLLQLPALRAVAWMPKRAMLVGGHCLALAGAVPLIFFGSLRELGDNAASAALVAFCVVGAGRTLGNTVWFPLLRSYVDEATTGRFFGVLRTAWHVVLIAYWLLARWWLEGHPGQFAPLFLGAWLLGVARTALIARMPERSERTGGRIRVREAASLLRSDAGLRRLVLGVSLSGALRASVSTFAIVMMNREIGFSMSDVALTTVAYFAGAGVSLYGWGRIVDRVGPQPVFAWTACGIALLFASLTQVDGTGAFALAGMVAFFFVFSLLAAGFGVADTRVLFALTPEHAPARTLVIASVTASAAGAVLPALAGLAIDRILQGGASPLQTYHGFFAVCAGLQLFAYLPLRRAGART